MYKRQVRVKIAMDQTPPEMTLGASVVGVGALAPRRVAVVPWQALSGTDGKPAIWVVDKANSTVSLRPVEVLSFETGSALIPVSYTHLDVYKRQCGTRCACRAAHGRPASRRR